MNRPRIFHEFTNKDGRLFEYSWFYSRMVVVEPLQADMSKEESAVDEMVYELYGLTEDEKDIVKGKEK